MKLEGSSIYLCENALSSRNNFTRIFQTWRCSKLLSHLAYCVTRRHNKSRLCESYLFPRHSFAHHQFAAILKVKRDIVQSEYNDKIIVNIYQFLSIVESKSLNEFLNFLLCRSVTDFIRNRTTNDSTAILSTVQWKFWTISWLQSYITEGT